MHAECVWILRYPLLFLLFLIIGNLLNNKVQEDPENTDSPVTDGGLQNTVPTYTINGYSIDISGISSSAFSSSLRAITDSGASAVSINLSDKNGTLLYKSSTAQKLGYQSGADSLIGLSSIVSSAKSRNCFTSAYITLTSLRESDPKIRSVRMAYEAAVVCEMAEAGINDIVLRCPEISGENIDELARLADNIKAINPNAVIGITFTREIMAHPDSAFYVDKLKGAYDFTCLDLSNNGEDNAVEYVNTAVSENLLYILRDKMRILLPSVDSDTQELLKIALASNSVSNWQIVS